MKTNSFFVAALAISSVFGSPFGKSPSTQSNNQNPSSKFKLPFFGSKTTSKNSITTEMWGSYSGPVIRIYVGTSRVGQRLQQFSVLVDTGAHGLYIPEKGLQDYPTYAAAFDYERRYECTLILMVENHLTSIVIYKLLVQRAKASQKLRHFSTSMMMGSQHILLKALTFFISAMCRDAFQSSW